MYPFVVIVAHMQREEIFKYIFDTFGLRITVFLYAIFAFPIMK